MRECDDPNWIVRKDRVELRPIDFSLVSGHGQEMEIGSDTSGDNLPRDEIGVMFHLREQNAVTRLELVSSPGRGDQINRFGRASSENDRFRFLGVQESGNPPPGVFVKRSSPITERVQPPMDVSVIVSVIPA